MTDRVEQSPLGREIESYIVRGQETDAKGRWIGADLELIVPRVGIFLLNVVTKAHFALEHLQNALDETEQLERLLDASSGTQLEEKSPFVLNDGEITYEILDRKFLDRSVEEDLANSMFFESPVNGFEVPGLSI